MIGGAPCSPELMKDMIFLTGIKEITVSLDFNNNNVIFVIIAKLFKKNGLYGRGKYAYSSCDLAFIHLGEPDSKESSVYDATAMKKLVTSGRFLEKNKLCVNKSKNPLEKCHNISKSLLMRVITAFEVKNYACNKQSPVLQPVIINTFYLFMHLLCIKY